MMRLVRFMLSKGQIRLLEQIAMETKLINNVSGEVLAEREMDIPGE